MYAAFSLNINNWAKEDRKPFFDIGVKLWNANAAQVSSALEKFLSPTGTLDGEAISNNWFPRVQADIFISHSHEDQDLAIALAGWLSHTVKLTAFVDSCVWGCADYLLKIVDNEYCQKDADENLYDYQSRNHSTSHVHMMLATALSQMIDRTECLFFLNTPHSISSKDVVSRTESPWIYAEVGILQIIRRHRPSRMKKNAAVQFSESRLRVKYPVNVESLIPLNGNSCDRWVERWKGTSDHPLDVLYELFPGKE